MEKKELLSLKGKELRQALNFILPELCDAKVEWYTEWFPNKTMRELYYSELGEDLITDLTFLITQIRVNRKRGFNKTNEQLWYRITRESKRLDVHVSPYLVRKLYPFSGLVRSLFSKRKELISKFQLKGDEK